MIEIVTVKNRKQEKHFVMFPFDLYKGCDYWVPPIIKEELESMDKTKNPVFKNAEAEFYLAYKDGKIAGRIAAIVNWVEIEEQKKNKLRFGWYDTIDDVQVSKMLIEKVIDFGKKRKLDFIETEIYKSKIEKNKNKKNDLTDSAKILIDLWDRGLNTRSGFKYGTAWRCYIGDIGKGHAPWLVVDSSKEGPENWAEICLSSRLASGVNKKWLYPIFESDSWRYLEVSRPPSDSRWSNPNKF